MSYSANLNHIGIALPNNKGQAPQLEKLFRILGISRGVTEAVPEQGVTVHFFNLPGDAPHLELLEINEPVAADNAVAKFVTKKGPGVHHLSFTVGKGTLDALCAELKKEGFNLVYAAPKKGAQNMRINFIHPSTTNGVMIELMETA